MAELIVFDLSDYCQSGQKAIEVISWKHRKMDGRRDWIGQFRCHCGKVFEAPSTVIRNKKRWSCGCGRGVKHRVMADGAESHPLYSTWENMKARCYRSSHRSYRNYGARGIGMSEAWKESFVAFASYVDSVLGDKPGPEFTLDRIDNSIGYQPGNIRWANPTTQVYNRRNSHPEFIGGVVSVKVVWARVAKGWTLEEAKNTPLYSKRPKETA